MKTITMLRDFDYRPKTGVIIAYLDGKTYQRVTEAAAEAIISAKAGKDADKSRAPRKAAGKDEGAAERGSIGD